MTIVEAVLVFLCLVNTILNVFTLFSNNDIRRDLERLEDEYYDI